MALLQPSLWQRGVTLWPSSGHLHVPGPGPQSAAPELLQGPLRTWVVLEDVRVPAPEGGGWVLSRRNAHAFAHLLNFEIRAGGARHRRSAPHSPRLSRSSRRPRRPPQSLRQAPSGAGEGELAPPRFLAVCRCSGAGNHGETQTGRVPFSLTFLLLSLKDPRGISGERRSCPWSRDPFLPAPCSSAATPGPRPVSRLRNEQARRWPAQGFRAAKKCCAQVDTLRCSRLLNRGSSVWGIASCPQLSVLPGGRVPFLRAPRSPRKETCPSV